MIRFLTDEHVSSALVDGLLDRRVDVVRVKDVGLGETEDPLILAWAAEQNRVVVTFDRQSMPGYAYARVNRGEPMPGVIVLDYSSPLGSTLDDLQYTAEAGYEADFDDQVRFFPLR